MCSVNLDVSEENSTYWMEIFKILDKLPKRLVQFSVRNSLLVNKDKDN
jgi:hypothetical protein